MSTVRQGAVARSAQRSVVALLICVWIWALPAGAQSVPAKSGIATAHPLATRAGEEILAAGGNAFDAAVAISAALAVVEPYASGLGGGGFWLLHEAGTGRQVVIDGREVAPAAATRDMYLDAQGTPRPGLTLNGPLAAGIPGEPAALAHLASRYGRLPLATSLAPAIRYAEQGIEASQGIAMGLKFRAEAARNSSAFAALYMPGGQPLQSGATVRFSDLARTLRRLAAEGHDGFYRGSVARRLVAGVQAAGGIWTREDLAAYKVIEREPLRVQYRAATMVMVPPPSSGGVVLGDALNILRAYDLNSLQPVERKHLTVEALRRAYRDRAMYLGDPAFVSMPIDRLLSPWYADGQRTSIRLDRATRSDDLPGIAPDIGNGANTTHFSVLDAAGNRVAATLSVNTWFGAAFIPPGTGVILNNEMDDFSIKVGTPNGFELLGTEANAIAPGKRMLSSMSPGFIESPRGVAILGTPGGSRIISMVLLSTLAWMDGADAKQMVSLKRYHHQYYPDVVAYEEGAFSAEEKTGLEARGHKLELSPRSFGNMQVVTWDRETGKVDAASDPRGSGEVIVY